MATPVMLQFVPSDWPYGVMIGQQDAPLPKSDKMSIPNLLSVTHLTFRELARSARLTRAAGAAQGSAGEAACAGWLRRDVQ